MSFVVYIAIMWFIVGLTVGVALMTLVAQLSQREQDEEREHFAGAAYTLGYMRGRRGASYDPVPLNLPGVPVSSTEAKA